MDNNKETDTLQHGVLEFVTVAVEYCLFVENATERTREDFVSTALKLLPLLYLKASLLNAKEDIYGEENADYVTEDNYNIVRNNIAYLLGDVDDFLDVFVEDMRYSDQPVLCTISEHMADIYQDLKNFVSAFRDGTDELREAALCTCQENFATYWGQRLVNVMRPLHDICHNTYPEE